MFSLDKEELIKFSEGDRKAFNMLYDVFSPRVYGICSRYTRCKDDANDILQNVFIILYEKRNTYKSEFPIWPWIKKIAFNASMKYIRENYDTFLTSNESLLDSLSDSTWKVEIADIKTMKEKLQKIVLSLPIGYRTIFSLFVIENLTHKEISEHLGITEGNSRIQFFKAKKRVQEILKGQNNN